MPAPYLESKRLYYKALSLENCTQEYVDWLNDEDVNYYLERAGNYTINKLREYLTEVEKDGTILFWAIYLKENNQHIGNIKIEPVYRKHKRGEYGIMIGAKEQWGKGYAGEATKTIINYCFENEDLHKITLGVVEDNKSAVELYKKLGFILEGKYIDHGIYGGKYCNQLRMAVFNPNH